MILATILGSIGTCLQVVGRGLRSSPDTGKTHLTIQDHGGHWWRHGSMNADRHWNLSYTNSMVAAKRDESLRRKKCSKCKALVGDGPRCLNCHQLNEIEPYCCPKCHRIINRPQCQCGHVIPPGLRSRRVIQSDGKLVEMRGDVFKTRRISKQQNGPAKWKAMYFRSCTDKGSKTFRAAAALFAKENHWAYPDPSWPFMPIDDEDYFRLCNEVPRDRLIPER